MCCRTTSTVSGAAFVFYCAHLDPAEGIRVLSQGNVKLAVCTCNGEINVDMSTHVTVGCVCFSPAIAEVGGVPFEILEPVLERCTPEQLYRIEQSNQVRGNLASSRTVAHTCRHRSFPNFCPYPEMHFKLFFFTSKAQLLLFEGFFFLMVSMTVSTECE